MYILYQKNALLSGRALFLYKKTVFASGARQSTLCVVHTNQEIAALRSQRQAFNITAILPLRVSRHHSPSLKRGSGLWI